MARTACTIDDDCLLQLAALAAPPVLGTSTETVTVEHEYLEKVRSRRNNVHNTSKYSENNVSMKYAEASRLCIRAQELCESRGGRPGLPVLICLMVPVDVKHHVYFTKRARVQELCESQGGRPGLPVLTILTVSVDVKHPQKKERKKQIPEVTPFAVDRIFNPNY